MISKKVKIFFLFSFSILLFSLLICTCELFNSKLQQDFLEIIDEEIRWSNAKKLTVRVDYPGEWGSSNPPAGQISPSPRDFRFGYAFELEFTPDIVYAFKGWKAYATTKLEALNSQTLTGDWRNEMDLLDEVEPLLDVVIPTLPAGGGKGSFTVNTTTPVTLVPWCQPEPRVIRTEPRTEAHDSADMSGYHPSTLVVFHFNSALDPDIDWTKAIETGLVVIEARPTDKIAENADFKKIDGPHNFNDWFEYADYSNMYGQHTVTIYPKTNTSEGPQPGYQIKVTIDGIRDARGGVMTLPEILYYKVANLEGVDAKISGWSAEYNPVNKEITVTCTIDTVVTLENNNSVKVKAYYYMNQGLSVDFDLDCNTAQKKYTGTFGEVSEPDAGGVREGRTVSNIREYRIFIDVTQSGYTADSANFKIWNFPDPLNTSKGMNVAKNGEAIEIRTAEEFADIADNLNGQYVLARDITVSDHTPIGTSDGSNAFTGKFYGNGHTITVDGFGGSVNRGISGYANNALIRDLSLVYTGTTSLSGATSVTNVGGIVGSATGSTRILNCIVRGDQANSVLRVTANAQTRLGGIAGYMQDTARIENCRTALNVTLESSGNNVLHVGGAVGLGGSDLGGTNENVELKGINAVGRVSMNKTNASGENYCGGIAGRLLYTTMTDCVFGGIIDIPSTFSANTDYSYIGGLVGDILARSNADNCHVTGSITVYSSGGTSQIRASQICLGGVIGRINGMNPTDKTVIKNSSYSNGVILFDSSGNGNNIANSYLVGGFVGFVERDSEVKNCESRGTSVTARLTSNNSSLMIGGFAGRLTMVDISDCSSTSPVIVPASHTSTGGVRAGGFAGSMEEASSASSNMENCFAGGSVNVHCRSTVDSIGGFVGSAGSNNTSNPAFTIITQCYATGDVTAVNYAADAASPTTQGFYVGGLAGNARRTEIRECYAIGRVEARKGSGGNMPVVVGGLVGLLGFQSTADGRMSSIADCYATGDVIADNPSANAEVYAGGLVGYIQIIPRTGGPADSDKVTRSFAAGSVSGKNMSSSKGIWVGGIAGYKASGELTNCIAAGRAISISAQGGDSVNRFAYRIFGASAGTAPANNYGRTDIFVGTDASYNANSVFLATANTLTTTGGQNGANAANDNLNSSTGTWATLGFTTAVWNFGPIARGYPALANVGRR